MSSDTILPTQNKKKHIQNDEEEVNNYQKTTEIEVGKSRSIFSKFFLIILIIISIVTYPKEGLMKSNEVTIGRVWYFSWITAISTGLGAIPFLFINKPNNFYFGVANAIAAGMMMSASFGLLSECLQSQLEASSSSPSSRGGDDGEQSIMSFIIRTFGGMAFGWIFLQLAKYFLDHNNLSIGFKDIKTKNFKKLILVVFVMTLHSFSEGVAIGVSFAGEHTLGIFISCSLAVHNIPEGLAISLVMMPCGVSFLDTFLWAIFTSIPQPLIAVPAYEFMEHFEPLLVVGLGFAAGAMLFVAVMELIPDACEKLPMEAAVAVTTVAFGIMTLIQWEAVNVI